MNALTGRKGAGCDEIPSSEELDALKAAASKTQEAMLRFESNANFSCIRHLEIK